MRTVSGSLLLINLILTVIPAVDLNISFALPSDFPKKIPTIKQEGESGPHCKFRPSQLNFTNRRRQLESERRLRV